MDLDMKQLAVAIRTIAEEKNLPEDSVKEVVEQALVAAYRRDYGDREQEIRVSMNEEIVAAIGEWIDDADRRAQRVIDFLQEVFESTFSFDLEGLDKKGVKQAGKTLARYQAASDYAIAWVTQKSLGGHSLPLDSGALRTLRRLKLIEDDENDMEAIRASLEHQIPKAKGTQFVDLMSYLSQEHCWEDDPACPQCPLKSGCPTGMTVPAPKTKKPR